MKLPIVAYGDPVLKKVCVDVDENRPDLQLLISNSNYRYNFDRMVNSNMRQTNPLLNPFAWGKLMQTIFSGDKLRSEDR